MRAARRRGKTGYWLPIIVAARDRVDPISLRGASRFAEDLLDRGAIVSPVLKDQGAGTAERCR
jgi:hypothetical protein